MFIPFSIFLIIYLVGIIIHFVFLFFNLYHIVRFGFLDAHTVTVSILFLLFIALVLGISIFFIAQVNWSEGISLDFTFSL